MKQFYLLLNTIQEKLVQENLKENSKQLLEKFLLSILKNALSRKKPLKEQNLKQRTFDILGMIKLNYWCENEDEKDLLNGWCSPTRQ